ncbi:NAD(P)-dependent oxidoreductase [Promicromonospora iranensis]|uniref:3-hydroxyisobutyrate dehydrogenase-like beta-hydroxyacid dehydrogenase n=1 Tax=Promicromonospora iranensis TaxID=1105144 RepID=A0ABU2CR28_9MICO|nr:NAD(P)-binding domain-containing protein [Promicromonospora iranensis]MDR7383612.1 3-hydroxyisobutyrate dehydrogenase-like beta-hydroxyacid dehydrogenase [Promicromonospora iranensis]
MSTPVTVIGLGPMGQAMVHTLLREGHQVTVWNRTAGRAADVAAAGATVAATPAAAVAASKLVILSLTDYQAMYDILGSATEALAGRTLVNLSSDSPDVTREGAAWAEQHGARFLTGGVMTPAPMVGTEAAYVYYSGPAEVFEADRETLAKLGAPRYLGEDLGLAQLMYLAHLDVFLTSLASLMHATALLESGGVTASAAFPELMLTVTGIGEMLAVGEGENPGAQIDAGEHPGDLSTAAMMGATADHIVAASKAVGVDTGLPAAVQAYYAWVRDNGYGNDNWTRIIDAMRPQGR